MTAAAARQQMADAVVCSGPYVRQLFGVFENKLHDTLQVRARNSHNGVMSQDSAVGTNDLLTRLSRIFVWPILCILPPNSCLFSNFCFRFKKINASLQRRVFRKVFYPSFPSTLCLTRASPFLRLITRLPRKSALPSALSGALM
jgi:hypothetical protein